MKLKSLALSSLAAFKTTIADEDYYDDPFPGLRGLADTHGNKPLLQMLRAEICKLYHSDKSLRKCPAKTTHIEAALRNYGCNCWPSNFDGAPAKASSLNPSWHMGKNGRPVSDLDAACMKMRDQLTCLALDRQDGLYVDPVSGSAHLQKLCGRFTTFEFHQDGSGNIICGPASNPEYGANVSEDMCKLASCSIQREFSIEAAVLLGASPSSFPASNANEYGIFMDDNRCAKSGDGSGNVVTECCGDYPSRLPFNSLFKVCCGDGGNEEAKYVGECGG